MKSSGKTMKREAFLCFSDYAGNRRYPCFVVAETPKRFRVSPAARGGLPLPGRGGLLLTGDHLVPKTAVRFRKDGETFAYSETL